MFLLTKMCTGKQIFLFVVSLTISLRSFSTIRSSIRSFNQFQIQTLLPFGNVSNLVRAYRERMCPAKDDIQT